MVVVGVGDGEFQAERKNIVHKRKQVYKSKVLRV